MQMVGAKRMTHLQRILGVYPFLYTFGYRANRRWLPADNARDRGAFLLTYPEMIGLGLLVGHTELLHVGRSTIGLIILLVAFVALSELIHHLNRRFLVEHGVGTRFAARFDRIAFADKVWMAFYSLLFIILCFAPMIGFPVRPT